MKLLCLTPGTESFSARRKMTNMNGFSAIMKRLLLAVPLLIGTLVPAFAKAGTKVPISKGTASKSLFIMAEKPFMFVIFLLAENDSVPGVKHSNFILLKRLSQ